MHDVAVTIEMVGGDIEKHADVGTEIVHGIQLEGRDFEHRPVVFLPFGHLQCQALPDVAAKSDAETGLLKNIIDE